MPSEDDRMCVRRTCPRAGQPTTARRCPECGYVTEPWTAEAAERLRSGAAEALDQSFRRGMPISTANDVPGWQITGYIGEVFGVIVQARGAFPVIGANLKSAFGGEIGQMTTLLRETRQKAIDRMVEEATHRGADAIVAMRFDVTTMGDAGGWTEICAYGTAVSAAPIASDPVEPAR